MISDKIPKITSWNIQSSNSDLGSKFDDPEFCNVFNKSFFICLQEIRQLVKHPGYRTFNNTRKENRNGGVCIMVKNDISHGVKQYKTNICDVIVCKLEKSFFGLPREVFLVNSYIKPANTSNKNSEMTGLDILHELDNLINILLGKGDVILCGDFNARIGRELDFIATDECGADSFIPVPDDHIPLDLPNRNSQDKKTNSYKRPFLDILINNELHVLNGRTLGDFAGKFTCIQTGGASVVDYFIISPQIKNLVSHMTVEPLTQFSDHKPLTLAMNFSQTSNCNVENKPLHESYNKAPLRYKLTPDSYTHLGTSMEKQSLKDRTHAILENNCDNMDTHELNDTVTKHLQNIADDCLQKSKHLSSHRKFQYLNKKPWFDQRVREAKQSLGRATRIVSDFPNSQYLRQNFYKVKKTYKSLVKNRKEKFLNQLNSDIESGKVLNWKQFKKLKDIKSKKLKFDSMDMENFEKFFSELYSNVHGTISKETKELLAQEASNINEASESENPLSPQGTILNKIITENEILTAIKSLKNGKSSADDMICNEILKSLSNPNLKLLAKLYNSCLNSGIYPWNNSIISPLHKKGCQSDPDNYRAVAVSSTIGKLFSTVLLDRILKFKSETCPDPINQLGFSKGAQTYDHILTLNTIVSKYKKLKSPVFAVFVDFRKAFDSVCREALFLKLSKLGFTGKIFKTLQHMYKNSTGQIKMSGHVSNKFDIRKGTEQGHPLSPDLFKIYIRDLSELLNQENCPKLMGQLVSHLLWADDLILLALDPITLQKQLDTLRDFCKTWGIEINVDKTKLMKFNSKYDSCPTQRFNIGKHHVKEVDSYCYLGIEIHKSGSFSVARSELKKKAMRSLYGLKNTINKSKLSFRSLTTLFDSLIKPIALYGAPIVTPNMSIIKDLSNTSLSSKSKSSVLRKISLLNCEKVHLHFLKWSLGVNRKSVNCAVWGESGRYPLVYECINLTLKYVQRLDMINDSSLVKLAFMEQRKEKLDWYRHLEPLLRLDPCFSADHVTAHNLRLNKNSSHTNTSKSAVPPKEDFMIHNGFKKRIPQQNIKPHESNHFTPYVIMKALKSKFNDLWRENVNTSSKLEFYKLVKPNFTKETYLDTVLKYKDRTNLTRLRISAHRLEIELGRRNGVSRQDRICKWCIRNSHTEEIEDESHLLNSCALYDDIRNNLITKAMGLLTNHDHIATQQLDIAQLTNSSSQLLKSVSPENQAHLCRITARYISNAFSNREKFINSLGAT